jgi:UDP-N-acetylglucosamine--N-acetylmuramyl-(pentapeptide) pyrophosphoryl-undecaprenol N-acetylglucosamine transferase
MKIVLTGGGTGGHFYPIIAVAEAIRKYTKEHKIIEPELYFLAPTPYNEQLLFDNLIQYREISAGKMRRYFSIKNIIDFIKFPYSIIKSLWTMFWIYPDVVFSKGGYGSFPVVIAAKVLGIPVIIHESDSTPGKANLWASKIAEKIAISYPEAANYFPKEKVAWTGNPVRKAIEMAAPEGAKEFLNLKPGLPVILVLGGSQGAEIINDIILESLPKLADKYQIIHQTGKEKFESVKNTSKVVLLDSPDLENYKPFAYLDDLGMRMSAGAADIVISRAGSALFEIANWKKPSIIIPITNTNGDHQRKNAYTYARTGAATVIEESNLSDDILVSEIQRILENEDVKKDMVAGTEKFAKPDAAETIAAEIMKIILKHQK